MMTLKIPFQVVALESKSYHIIVEGKIDDIELTLIIDTGASRTIIDKSFSFLLKELKQIGEKPMATGLAAEQIPVELYKIAKLKFGDVTFKGVQVLSADLNPINEVYTKLTGKKIGGLIGCDFLLKKVKTIDFKRKCLTIKNKG